MSHTLGAISPVSVWNRRSVIWLFVFVYGVVDVNVGIVGCSCRWLFMLVCCMADGSGCCQLYFDVMQIDCKHVASTNSPLYS